MEREWKKVQKDPSRREESFSYNLLVDSFIDSVKLVKIHISFWSRVLL